MKIKLKKPRDKPKGNQDDIDVNSEADNIEAEIDINDFDLDKNHLIKETATIPHLIWKYGNLHGKINELIKYQKLYLQNMEGDVYLNIKRNLKKYKLPSNPTESAIKKIINVNLDIHKERRLLIKLERIEKDLDTAETAIKQKASMLKEQSALYQSQYYSLKS